MGTFTSQQTFNQPSKQDRLFLDKIQKVSTGSLQKFGNFNIYQQKEKPYDYFIEYIQTSILTPQMLEQKVKFYKNLPKSKNLVPVHHAEIFKSIRKEMCAAFDGIRILCPYYNFTLEDAIKLKIKQKINFTEPQTVYIFRSLLSIGKFYQNELKLNFYSGIYKTKNVFVSPEGHIKIYPFNNDNIFAAYIDRIQNPEPSFQSQESDSKKVSIDYDQKMKPYIQTRDESSIFKSNLSKGQIGLRKSKLTTTLCKQRIDPVKTQQLLQLKGMQFQQIIRQPSKSILSHQQSYQTLNYLYRNLSMNEGANKRDFFQLGLVMMQIILLNQEQQYYKQKQPKKQINQQNQGSKFSRQSSSRQIDALAIGIDSFNKNQNLRNKNWEKFQEYQNEDGKVPNMDLISFSIGKLLPKKNISKTIIHLIEKMVMGKYQDQLEYDQSFQIVQKCQQKLSRPRYCLKFQNTTEEKADEHVSSYMMKSRTINSLNKPNQFSLNYIDEIKSDPKYKSDDYVNLKASMPKESFTMSSSKKLQDLLSSNNLAKSMMFQQSYNNSSQVLNNLKKSRKLVPAKIRSISMKSDEKAK